MGKIIQRRFIIHTIILWVLGGISITGVYAQTDIMFTKYQFNSLAFNPGYAGSKEFMTLNALHRSQWLGIKGGPSAQNITIHSPIQGRDRMGVGASIFNQNIGTIQSIGLNLSYAYRISLGQSPYAGKIAIGMQGGIMNWRANFSKIETDLSEDQSFKNDFPSLWLPNFGAGIYYYSKYYYLGFSSPNILEHNLRDKNETAGGRNAKTFRHYYGVAGAAIPIRDGDIVFKPSFLFKTVALLSRFKNEESAYRGYGSPMETTIDFSVLLYEKIWIGAAYRTAIGHLKGATSHDSADLWFAYYFANKLYVGLAYDYTLTKLQTPAKASFEVSVGYDFNLVRAKTYSPRYF